MFERFHRVENARGRSHEGSGIGLALVSELVKLHGGSIAVESTLGQGTTFIVRIPQGRRASAGGASAWSRHRRRCRPRPVQERTLQKRWSGCPPQPSQCVPRQNLPRVLLADDNADLREYARRLLSEHYEVHVVADGQAALEAARELRPDLIVSDVMMPRLDGFGLIREVRADPQLRATADHSALGARRRRIAHRRARSRRGRLSGEAVQCARAAGARGDTRSDRPSCGGMPRKRVRSSRRCSTRRRSASSWSTRTSASPRSIPSRCR